MRLFASFTVDPASHGEKHRQNRQAGCEDSRQEGGRVPGTESGEAGAASRPAAAEGSPASRTGEGGTRNPRGNQRPLALIHPAGGPRPCPTNIELSAGWPLAESRARHSAIWSIAPGRIRRSQVGCIRSEHPRRARRRTARPWRHHDLCASPEDRLAIGNQGGPVFAWMDREQDMATHL